MQLALIVEFLLGLGADLNCYIKEPLREMLEIVLASMPYSNYRARAERLPVRIDAEARRRHYFRLAGWPTVASFAPGYLVTC